jgi:hypothetical protein
MVGSTLSWGFFLMQAMVRVELHRATEAAYQILHFSMAGAGFSRILRSSRTGKLSYMPAGTYWTELSPDPYVVLEAAQKAALIIDRTAEIVVSVGNQIVYCQCQDAIERPAPGSAADMKVSLHGRFAPIRGSDSLSVKFRKRSSSTPHGHGSN